MYNGPYCQLYVWTMYRVYFGNDYDRLFPYIEVNFGTKWKSKPKIIGRV